MKIGIIEIMVIIIIGMIIGYTMYYLSRCEKYNTYVVLCEKEGGYIFRMYDHSLFCMKGEFIKIEGYDDINNFNKFK